MKNDEQKKYSISEFAKACGTTKDTLYHYEKQGILVPAFDENNHYRLYSTLDFHLFQYIAHLRRMGFSVSDIRDCMNNRNVSTYLQMLSKGSQHCLDEISDLKHRYSIISKSLESTSRFSDIQLEIPGVRYAEEACFYASSFSGRFDSLEGIRQIQQHLLIAESMPDVTSNITVFKIGRSSLKEGYSPRLCIMTQTSDPSAVAPENLHVKPQGSYLQMFFNTDIVSASNEDIYRFSQKMQQYASEHNYRFTTDFYAILHISTFLTDDPKEYLTEFLVGIE